MINLRRNYKRKENYPDEYILEHIPQKPNRRTFNSGSHSSIKFVKRCTLANEDVKHMMLNVNVLTC